MNTGPYSDEELAYGVSVSLPPSLPFAFDELTHVATRIGATIARLKRERDEARSIARALAVHGIPRAIWPSGPWDDAVKTALAYPVTSTKE
jgi:hypothetical protein